MPNTDSLLLRFAVTASGCRLTYRWGSDPALAVAAFGDPVPVFLSGVRAGFHVHDVYHLTLLAETGFSAVLDILLAGARDGVFGGVDALAEEAVVLQHHLAGRVDPDHVVAMLAGKVSDPRGVARAFGRGDELRHSALRQLAASSEARVAVDGIPGDFVARARRYRAPAVPRRRSRSRAGADGRSGASADDHGAVTSPRSPPPRMSTGRARRRGGHPRQGGLRRAGGPSRRGGAERRPEDRGRSPSPEDARWAAGPGAPAARRSSR